MATKTKGKTSSKKRAKANKSASPAKPKPIAQASGETLSLAYDAKMLNDFVLGNITLGELEGIDKKVQYQIAERGYKLLQEGRLDEADKIFRGLVTLDPFDSYFHTVLGSILQRRDQKDEAIEEYSRALKVNPLNVTALANRGEVYFVQGRILEATQDIQAALQNDPNCTELATKRCRVLALALAELIKDNQEKIMAELAKVKAEA